LLIWDQRRGAAKQKNRMVDSEGRNARRADAALRLRQKKGNGADEEWRKNFHVKGQFGKIRRRPGEKLPPHNEVRRD